MWAIDAVAAATALATRFAPVPAAAFEATSRVAGRRRLPSTSPTRPPASATRKHQTAYRTRSTAGILTVDDRSAVPGRRRARGARDPARCSAARPYAPADARRARRPGACAGRGQRAAHGDRAGPPVLDGPLWPAGHGQDHA